jgi:hypothetical protein
MRRIVIPLAVALALPTLACASKTPAPAVPPPPATSAAGHTIRFEVTSRPGITALVNWSTVGDSAILHDQTLPWAKDVRLDAAAGLVGINATSSDGGRIACKLFVDGKQIKANESDGTVNCSTTVG